MNKFLKPVVCLSLLSMTVAVNAAPVLNTNNGHYYDFIFSGVTSWDSANTAASSSSYAGVQGHLATITSAEENSWLTGQGHNFDYYLGGSDKNSEGTWEWVTGEAWTYSNWNINEPNDFGWFGEDYLVLLGGFSLATGKWNDVGGLGTGYIVEYDVSAVPIPAAAFLFAPALLGFMGFRHKAKKVA